MRVMQDGNGHPPFVENVSHAMKRPVILEAHTSQKNEIPGIWLERFGYFAFSAGKYLESAGATDIPYCDDTRMALEITMSSERPSSRILVDCSLSRYPIYEIDISKCFASLLN